MWPFSGVWGQAGRQRRSSEAEGLGVEGILLGDLSRVSRWLVGVFFPEEWRHEAVNAMVQSGQEWGQHTESLPLVLVQPFAYTGDTVLLEGVILSFADLEMPAVLQHLEKDGQKEEAELSC